MGMFDYVRLHCPSCRAEYLAQSKGGDCFLEAYDLIDCPEDVLSNVNRHAPFECTVCRTLFYVDQKTRAERPSNPTPPEFRGINGFYRRKETCRGEGPGA